VLEPRTFGARRHELAMKSAPAHVGATDERRILVVANDTLEEDVVVCAIERLASVPRSHVRVLAPTLVSARARCTCDVDGPREQARRRLEQTLGRLGNGSDATGE